MTAKEKPLVMVLHKASRRHAKSATTHLFRHVIAGRVVYVGSYESASLAVKATGRRENALWNNYRDGLTTSIPGTDGQAFHLIQNPSLDFALLEAQRRSWVKEVYDRLNLAKLSTLPVETLKVMHDQLP